MSRAPELRQQIVVWGLILLLWCLMVLAFAGQLVLAGSVEWTQAINISLRDWWPWALLTPVVAWLASVFRFERGQAVLSIPVHLAACMVTVVICQLLTGPPPERPGDIRHRNRPMQNPLATQAPANAPMPDLPQTPFPSAGAPPLQTPTPPPAPEPRGFLGEHLLNRRAQFNIPIYWIIVSLAHALSYYRRSQEREQRARDLEVLLTQSRLESLRAQLQPHFLFNTLNAISTLVHKDPHAADEMIANLSELLRGTLDTSGQQKISLQRELDLLSPYLEIQQVRFGDRLRIERQIAPDTLDIEVPVLLLQPLVENAIRHGIEPRPGPGFIRIEARRENAKLHLAVCDNGAGLKETPSNGREGIGLSNTKARLEALYGAEAQLLLKPVPAGGCSVEVTLPVQARDTKSPNAN